MIRIFERDGKSNFKDIKLESYSAKSASPPDVQKPNNKMKNIGYILSGYDLWFGNPLAVEQTVDPGFRGQIFAAHYGDTLTADNRYCVPGKLS